VLLLDSKRENKKFWTEWYLAFPEFNLFSNSTQFC